MYYVQWLSLLEMYMYFHLIIHTFILNVTLCFGFEAACSKNKDDINLMGILVFCLSLTTDIVLF